MTQERLQLGRWGEEVAATYLRKKGLKILAANFRTPVGEVDLIARDRRTLVFVEVKTRRGRGFGLPQEAVNARKQRQLMRAAQWYLAANRKSGAAARFDVVAVCLVGGELEVEHLTNAFELEG